MLPTNGTDDLESVIVAILLNEWNELPDETEMSRLLDLAQGHGVLPLVALRLLDSGRVDGELRARLEDQQNQAIAADAVWERETIRVLDAINKAGVEAVLLKGMALAHSLYEQPHLRPRVDVDILVDRESLEAMRNLFRSLGYHERSSWGGDLHHSQTAFQKQLLPGVRFTWDVHWLLTNRFAWGSRFQWPEILEATIPIPSLGSSARALSRPWALLHACVHLVGHHGGEERLIWLWDIKLLLETISSPELDLFLSLAERFDMDEVVGQAMAEVAVRELVESQFVTPFTISRVPAERRRITRMWRDLQSLPGSRLKFEWIVQLLFPSRSALERMYGRSISRALVPLFIVRRWLRGAIRVLRRRPQNGNGV